MFGTALRARMPFTARRSPLVGRAEQQPIVASEHLRAGFVFLGSRLLANQTWPFRAGLGAKSMKVAPGGLIQQGQQRGSEVLHLLLRLGAGLGCVRVKQGT